MKNKNIITILIISIIIIISILIIYNLTNQKIGDLKEITYEEILEKQKNKDDFILVVSRSNCSHCLTYKPKVQQIAKEHNIIIYYIDFDKYKNEEELLKSLKLSGATPMTLFFINGKETSMLNRIEGDIATNKVTEKIKKMGFID